MKTSKDGFDLIKQFEGCKLKSYKCPADVWTIGYGHTATAKQNMTITKEKADELLEKDVEFFEVSLNKLSLNLTQNEFDCLISFIFNVGFGAFLKSTILKKIKQNKKDEVPFQLMRWTKAGGKELPGLVRRRRAEAALWRGIDQQKERPEELRITPDLPKPKKSIAQSREASSAVVAGLGSAAGIVGEAKNFVDQGADFISTLSQLAKMPAFWVLIGVAFISVLIWYWRKQRLDEYGI